VENIINYYQKHIKKLEELVKFSIGTCEGEIFWYKSEDIIFINWNKSINISFVLTKNIWKEIKFNSSILEFKIKPLSKYSIIKFHSQFYKNKLINNQIFYFKYINKF